KTCGISKFLVTTFGYVDSVFYCQLLDIEFKKLTEKSLELPLKKEFLTDAPLLIIVAGETDKPYWLESAWIFIAYIILAAESEGLATLTLHSRNDRIF
ncbi:MAG: nitroreductase family protein, partial [Candidatus Thermoplasmatota archaeon]|nr:nitroreductase family protein [Candidatus Thermoplasmatota archaeon]